MKVIQNIIKSHWQLIVVLIAALVPLIDLLHPGLFVAHDSQDHVARVANFYANLQEGNVIPRWAGNLNWGFGHPILMFLYPLPSYIASYFVFLGMSFVDATKMTFALGYFLSGLTMYLWISRRWGNNAGLVSSVLYLFAPYRFVDLYVRGAIGENLFFVWPPLILYFIDRLSHKFSVKNIILGALSVASMILSHNALSLMFLPFILVYAAILLTQIGKKLYLFISYLAMIGLGFGLSAFFWMPAFFEGKYTLRDIVTEGVTLERFESLSRLIYSKWNYGGTGELSVQVGIVHWIVILVSLFFCYHLYLTYKSSKKFEVRKSYLITLLISISLLLFFVISLFLIIEPSKPLYEAVAILQKFQFPWRWLSLSLFAPSVLAGIIVSFIHKNKQRNIAILLSISAVILTMSFWHAVDYKQYDESYFTNIYNGTTDTGESSPIWSVRFMLERPGSYAEIIDGKADIRLISRSITSREYALTVTSSTARVLENTLYFPGWTVYIDDIQLDTDTQLEWQDPNHRGLITYHVPNGSHVVRINFEDTNLRSFSDTITSASILALLILMFTPWVYRTIQSKK